MALLWVALPQAPLAVWPRSRPWAELQEPPGTLLACQWTVAPKGLRPALPVLRLAVWPLEHWVQRLRPAER